MINCGGTRRGGSASRSTISKWNKGTSCFYSFKEELRSFTFSLFCAGARTSLDYPLRLFNRLLDRRLFGAFLHPGWDRDGRLARCDHRLRRRIARPLPRSYLDPGHEDTQPFVRWKEGVSCCCDIF